MNLMWYRFQAYHFVQVRWPQDDMELVLRQQRHIFWWTLFGWALVQYYRVRAFVYRVYILSVWLWTGEWEEV